MPTRSAMNEMYDNDLDFDDVTETLEDGFDCSRSKRDENIFERCIQKGDIVVKVVAAVVNDHIVITHVGKFRASRKKMRQLRER